MGTNKTIPTNASVTEFLEAVEDPSQKQDSFRLMELMKGITKEPAVMWGPSIVGFGSYHYRYESGREGDMLRVGFSPRKGKIALYIGAQSARNQPLLNDLGPHNSGKSCLYIKRLDKVDLEVLSKIISNTFNTYKN